MAEYIKKSAARRAVLNADPSIAHCIDNIEPVDAISRDAFEQVCWERDVAMEQLNSYGVALGEKADVQKVVHGYWKEWWSEDYITYFHKCSVCDEDALTKEETYHDEVLSKYCPNCGAKMDGGNEYEV